MEDHGLRVRFAMDTHGAGGAWVVTKICHKRNCVFLWLLLDYIQTIKKIIIITMFALAYRQKTLKSNIYTELNVYSSTSFPDKHKTMKMS